MKNKVILIDSNIFVFRAIMAWRAGNRSIPITYTYLNMLLSNLKRIGVNKEDKIIITIDGRGGSWRKSFLGEYKANRKDFRKQYEEEINWKEIFGKFEDLYIKLHEATDWHFIRLTCEYGAVEADDIMSVAAKYFKDSECIIVSSDADLQQLCAFPNVKIFSPLVKIKNGKGGYKEVKNPYKIIADKVKKGDVADNIIVRDNDTEEDVRLREFVINLLDLPNFIEEPIIEKFEELEEREANLNKFPFKALKDRYYQIYEKDKVISYEECINYKKKVRKKTKKKTKKEKTNV